MEKERKLLFDDVVEQYASARPGYPPELIADIITISKVDEHSEVLEIGCGAGQATELLLKAGLPVTAVEIGANMCAYVLKRFRDYDKFRVINLPFEMYESATRYDLVLSASAFHWIDPAVGYAKAHSLLKDSGWLVLVWNGKDETKMQSGVWPEIDQVYAELLPPKDTNIHKHEARLQAIIDSGYFEEPDLHTYPYELSMTGEEYIRLLGTYSDHIAMENDLRERLYTSVREIILKHGGSVTVPYAVKAYYARRKGIVAIK